MALLDIKELKKMYKQRNSIHEKVKATYCILNDSTGEKYFQIDTYGKSDREHKDKISQSFQLNRESAIDLIKLLKKEFDIYDIPELDIKISTSNNREMKK